MIKTLKDAVLKFPEELQELAETILNELDEGAREQEIEQIIKGDLKEIVDKEVTELESN
jgi:hypothetical protein